MFANKKHIFGMTNYFRSLHTPNKPLN